MAQRIVVELTSDISGEVADETVSFTLDGVSYEIDLTADEIGALRTALEPYTSHARKVGRAATPRKRSRAASATYNPSAVRAWAHAQGIQVSERGRVPKSVLDKYKAAHG